MKRRDLLKMSAFAGLAAAAAAAVPAEAGACPGDGTPLQFTPKSGPDARPLDGELEKHPKCPYCGMDRREHHRSRMLVRYSDDLVDGVCSIHCLSLSLGLNVDREPKAIFGPDYASTAEPRPLLPVDQLSYLVGADLKHAMTRRSKHSFASPEAAKDAQGRHGGTLARFDEALRESYLDMAGDVTMIRKMREERRKRAAQQG